MGNSGAVEGGLRGESTAPKPELSSPSPQASARAGFARLRSRVRSSYDACCHPLFAFNQFGGMDRCVLRSQHSRLEPRDLVVARYRSAYRRLALLASLRPGMIYYRRSHRVLIIIGQIRGGHDGGGSAFWAQLVIAYLRFAAAAGPASPANPPSRRNFSHLACGGADVDADLDGLWQPDQRVGPRSGQYY